MAPCWGTTFCRFSPCKATLPTLHFCSSRGNPSSSCARNLNNIALTRVDPDVSKEKSKRPMYLAWRNDHVGAMTELAKYTEPDEEVQSSSVWELVEKRQERR